MTSIKTKVERRERRDDGRLVFVYDYQGPGGPAQAETRGDGTTHIDGQGIPATTVELDLHAKGRAFKAGVPGRVGDSTLQVVRPSFGLTPASRAMTFMAGRRCFMVPGQLRVGESGAPQSGRGWAPGIPPRIGCTRGRRLHNRGRGRAASRL